MNQHAKFNNLLNLSAAGALEEDEHQQVQDHIVQCDSCHAEFSGWLKLINALKQLPTPQAPATLLLKTQRLLQLRMAARKEYRRNWAILSFLILFSWMVAVLNWFFVRLLDIPLSRWLDVSSTTVWVAYIGLTWLATALAAGLLGKRLQHGEGNL
jgi:anti-sigma factor RsiW